MPMRTGVVLNEVAGIKRALADGQSPEVIARRLDCPVETVESFRDSKVKGRPFTAEELAGTIAAKEEAKKAK